MPEAGKTNPQIELHLIEQHFVPCAHGPCTTASTVVISSQFNTDGKIIIQFASNFQLLPVISNPEFWLKMGPLLFFHPIG